MITKELKIGKIYYIINANGKKVIVKLKEINIEKDCTIFDVIKNHKYNFYSSHKNINNSIDIFKNCFNEYKCLSDKLKLL